MDPRPASPALSSGSNRLAKYKRRKDKPITSQLRALEQQLGDVYAQTEALLPPEDGYSAGRVTPGMSDDGDEGGIPVGSDADALQQILRLRGETMAWQEKAKQVTKERDELRYQLDAQRRAMEEEMQRRVDSNSEKYKLLVGNATELSLRDREELRLARQTAQESEQRTLRHAEQLERKARMVILEYQEHTAALQHEMQQERLLLQEREFEISREADRMKINALNDVNYAIHLAVEKCNQRVAELEHALQQERTQNALNYSAARERLREQENELQQRLDSLAVIHKALASQPNLAVLSEGQRQQLELEMTSFTNREVAQLKQRVSELQASLASVPTPATVLAEREVHDNRMREKIHVLIQKNNQNVKDIDQFYANSELKHRQQTFQTLQDMETERRAWLEEATRRFREMEMAWESEKLDLLQQLSSAVRTGRAGPPSPTLLTAEQRCPHIISEIRQVLQESDMDSEGLGTALLHLDDLQAAYLNDIRAVEDTYSSREVESRNKYESRLTHLSNDYRLLQDKLSAIANDKAVQANAAMAAEIGHLNNIIEDLTVQLKDSRQAALAAAVNGIGESHGILENEVAELSAQLRQEKQRYLEREVEWAREKAELTKALQSAVHQQALSSPVSAPPAQWADHYRELYEKSEKRRLDDSANFESQVKELMEALQATHPRDSDTHYKQLYEQSEKRRAEDAAAFQQERAAIAGNTESGESALVEHYRTLYELTERRRADEAAANEVEKHRMLTTGTPAVEQDHYKRMYELSEKRRAEDAAAFEIEKNRLVAASMAGSGPISRLSPTNGRILDDGYKALYEMAERRRAEDAAKAELEKSVLLTSGTSPADPRNVHYKDLYEMSERRRAQDAANFEIEKARLLLGGSESGPFQDYQQLYEMSERRRTEDAAAFEIERQRLLSLVKQSPSAVADRYRELYQAAEQRRAEEAAQAEREKARLLDMSHRPPRADAIQAQLAEHYKQMYENSERRREQDIAAFEEEKRRWTMAGGVSGFSGSPIGSGDSAAGSTVHTGGSAAEYRALYELSEQRRTAESNTFAHEREQLLAALSQPATQEAKLYRALHDNAERRRLEDLQRAEQEKQRLLNLLGMRGTNFGSDGRSDEFGPESGHAAPSAETEQLRKYYTDRIARLEEAYEAKLKEQTDREQERLRQIEANRSAWEQEKLKELKDGCDGMLKMREEKLRQDRLQQQEDWKQMLEEARLQAESLLEQADRERQESERLIHEKYKGLLEERELVYTQQIRELRDKLERMRSTCKLEEEERKLQFEDQIIKQREDERAEFERQLTDRFQKSKEELAENYRKLIAQITEQHDAKVIELEERLLSQNHTGDAHYVNLLAQMEQSRIEFEEAVKERYRALMAQFAETMMAQREASESERLEWYREQEQQFEQKRLDADRQLADQKLALQKQYNEKVNQLKEETAHQQEAYKLEAEQRERKYRTEFEEETRQAADRRVEQAKQLLDNNYRERCQQSDERVAESERELRRKLDDSDRERVELERNLRDKFEKEKALLRQELRQELEEMKRRADAERDRTEEERAHAVRDADQKRLAAERELRQRFEREADDVRRGAQREIEEREKGFKKELEQLKQNLEAIDRENQIRQQRLLADREAQLQRVWEERQQLMREQADRRAEDEARLWEKMRATAMQNEKDLHDQRQEMTRQYNEKYDRLFAEAQQKAKDDVSGERRKLSEDRASFEREKREAEQRTHELEVQLEKECRARFDEEKQRMIQEHDTKVQEVKIALEREIAHIDGKIIEREREMERKLLAYEDEIRYKYDERYQKLERALHAEIEAYNSRIRAEREERVERDHKMWALYDMARMEFEENLRLKYEEALRVRDEKYKSQLQHMFAGVVS
eukprot:TRINITY_DN80905_c0_g1_i1.p1 TRINITY_DN80905_c0_g1~~TRINITY_DN80905_c0_g1_i1.p1  ORF type:complete len:1872 (-),score=477.88 TRINITY_DN80905_c0_g1_i1:33-5648(-)